MNEKQILPGVSILDSLKTDSGEVIRQLSARIEIGRGLSTEYRQIVDWDSENENLLREIFMTSARADLYRQANSTERQDGTMREHFVANIDRSPGTFITLKMGYLIAIQDELTDAEHTGEVERGIRLTQSEDTLRQPKIIKSESDYWAGGEVIHSGGSGGSGGAEEFRVHSFSVSGEERSHPNRTLKLGTLNAIPDKLKFEL